MDNTRRTCVLTYLTEYDTRKSVRINDPIEENVSLLNQISTFSGMLTRFQMFEDSIGKLSQLLGAEVVVETTDVII